jgi:hypothetical protein
MTDQTEKLITLLTDALEILDDVKGQHGTFINQGISRIKGGLREVQKERANQQKVWRDFYNYKS